VAAISPLEGVGEPPPSFPAAYLVPPAVAVRAASDLPEGVALYLGAWSCEVAAFGPGGMEDPTRLPAGLEPLYRATIAELFRAEGRPLLPLQVPALFRSGLPVEVASLLEGIVPFLGGPCPELCPERSRRESRRGPAALGGEDDAVVAAVAAALRERGHEATVVDPLAGLERLVWAVGGIG